MSSISRHLLFLVAPALVVCANAHADGRVKSEYEKMSFCADYIAGIGARYGTRREYNPYREDDTYIVSVDWWKPINRNDPVVGSLKKLGNEVHLKELLALDQKLNQLLVFVTADDPQRVLCSRDPLRERCLDKDYTLEVDPLRKICDLARAKNPTADILKRRESERGNRKDLLSIVDSRVLVVTNRLNAVEAKREAMEQVPGGTRCLEAIRARVAFVFEKAQTVKQSISGALASCDGNKFQADEGRPLPDAAR